MSPAVQSKGVGSLLMEGIKTKSLELGGTELYFTYDPFEAQNGRLYLTKCGGKAIRVYEDLYGKLESSAHKNRKTHRLLVRWDFQDEPVEKAIHGESIPIVTELSLLESFPKIRIEIPYSVQKLDDHKAAQWGERVLPILVEAINNRNYQATSVQKNEKDRKSFLVLEK